MWKDDDDSIESFFRKGVNQYGAEFNENDWRKMEKMLDEEKTRKALSQLRFWKNSARIAGALLLLMSSYFFITNKVSVTTSPDKKETPGDTEKPKDLITDSTQDKDNQTTEDTDGNNTAGNDLHADGRQKATSQSSKPSAREQESSGSVTDKEGNTGDHTAHTADNQRNGSARSDTNEERGALATKQGIDEKADKSLRRRNDQSVVATEQYVQKENANSTTRSSTSSRDNNTGSKDRGSDADGVALGTDKKTAGKKRSGNTADGDHDQKGNLVAGTTGAGHHNTAVVVDGQGRDGSNTRLNDTRTTGTGKDVKAKESQAAGNSSQHQDNSSVSVREPGIRDGAAVSKAVQNPSTDEHSVSGDQKALVGTTGTTASKEAATQSGQNTGEKTTPVDQVNDQQEGRGVISQDNTLKRNTDNTGKAVTGITQEDRIAGAPVSKEDQKDKDTGKPVTGTSATVLEPDSKRSSLAAKEPAGSGESSPFPSGRRETGLAGMNAESDSVSAEHKADTLHKEKEPEDKVVLADSTEKAIWEASRWSISLVGAPDFSSTRPGSNYTLKPGSEYGITIHYQFLSRWSFSTGLLRTSKVYTGRGADYHPPEGYWDYRTNGVVPETVDGSCTILEVPLSLAFDLIKTGRSRLLVSAGISSYLMRSEEYKYNFKEDNPGAAKDWSTYKPSSYPFGVGNLSVRYERLITPNISLGLEPYLRVPFAEVGWANINLYSTGVFFTARYLFFKRG